MIFNSHFKNLFYILNEETQEDYFLIFFIQNKIILLESWIQVTLT